VKKPTSPGQARPVKKPTSPGQARPEKKPYSKYLVPGAVVRVDPNNRFQKPHDYYDYQRGRTVHVKGGARDRQIEALRRQGYGGSGFLDALSALFW
jgi:hypothetical protein